MLCNFDNKKTDKIGSNFFAQECSSMNSLLKSEINILTESKDAPQVNTLTPTKTAGPMPPTSHQLGM